MPHCIALCSVQDKMQQVTATLPQPHTILLSRALCRVSLVVSIEPSDVEQCCDAPGKLVDVRVQTSTQLVH
jgi:hypothetical protein